MLCWIFHYCSISWLAKLYVLICCSSLMFNCVRKCVNLLIFDNNPSQPIYVVARYYPFLVPVT